MTTGPGETRGGPRWDSLVQRAAILQVLGQA